MTLESTLALLILAGKLGDVCSTLFATPTLKLETNPLARRFKWSTIALGFALCVVPFIDVRVGVTVAVPSLLITSSNLARGWTARALGEDETEQLILRAARRSSLSTALSMLWLAAVFFAAAATLLLFVSAGAESLAFWFALGLLLHAIGISIRGTLFLLRTFRRAATAGA